MIKNSLKSKNKNKTTKDKEKYQELLITQQTKLRNWIIKKTKPRV